MSEENKKTEVVEMKIPCYPCDKEIFPSAYPEVEGERESTTFYNDFKIAEVYSAKAIRDTFDRCFSSWSNSAKYLVELTVVVNHLCWEHHNKGNISVSEYYAECYYKCYDKMFDTNSFTKEERMFMSKVID